MNIKRILSLAIGLVLFGSWVAKASGERHQRPDRPRIVVTMVVDQMSWDYLYRYNERFGPGGFRRLLSEGFNCQNARINYIPSVTAIGHASIYTGSVPSIHGIAGNNFYINGKRTYCTEDLSTQPVGAEAGTAGQMSPRNLLTTTIADELKIATNFRSRVIGVSIKDRGAILPAGHSADAAYWFDDKSGRFITSTYYMQELPRWVQRFNDRRLAEKYLKADWKPLYNLRTYKESIEDNNPFEVPWGETPATLPLPTSKIMKTEGLGIIRATPMGNTLTLDMARAAIEGERLGERPEEADFLAISLSSTDYVGHRYASFSVELEDTYLRLDRELSDFFSYLDKRYGKEGYLFVITADHAVAHNIDFLASRKLPGRKWRSDIAREIAGKVALEVAGTTDVIVGLSTYQLVLDEEVIQARGVDRDKLISRLIRELGKQEGVAYVVEADKINISAVPDDIRGRMLNGYNRLRSGQIFIVPHPGWTSGRGDGPTQGADHSVWAPYDTHIPLIFMGKGIKPGFLHRQVDMTDISATLAFLLKTQLPSGAIGRPITEVLGED